MSAKPFEIITSYKWNDDDLTGPFTQSYIDEKYDVVNEEDTNIYHALLLKKKDNSTNDNTNDNNIYNNEMAIHIKDLEWVKKSYEDSTNTINVFGILFNSGYMFNYENYTVCSQKHTTLIN